MPRKGTPKGKRKGGLLPPTAKPGGRQNRVLDSFFRDTSGNSSSASLAKAPARAHTLADEARNTAQRHRGAFGQDGKLRFQPLTFISAGTINPMKELEILQEGDKKANSSPDQIPPPVVQITVDAGDNDDGDDVPRNDATSTIVTTALKDDDDDASPATELFVLDPTGDKSLRPKQRQTVSIPEPHESSHDSDSSEEVILFKGRDNLRRKPSARPTAQLTDPQRLHEQRLRSEEDTIQLREMDVEIKVVEKTIVTGTPSPEDHPVPKTEKPIAAPRRPSVSPPPSRAQGAPSLEALLDNTQSDEEAAIVADYIANVNRQEDDEGDAEETDQHPGLGSYGFSLLRDLGGTDSDAISGDDSDDESTSENDADDADDSDSSKALRKKMELDDEHLARMLAKQEELGFHSEDIMLFDGADPADDDDEDGVWQLAPKGGPRRRTKKGSTKKAKIIKQKGQYPSATAMADAFDDLDLMDWRRAALGNLNQAASRATVPHCSDSELEEAMRISFQKDRIKKAEKKKQREVLRAQGLLGKNVNPDDLRVKYPVGMARDDLVFELEQFLTGTDQQLAFPPLDKSARKQLHLVASHLKIKSVSSGAGTSRYPVLHRTGRTMPFDDRIFDSLVNRFLNRTFFARVDVDTETAREYRALRSKDPNNSRARGRNAVSYREGEVVGEHAAELASDNKGRVLLEKMGWTKGMALGTMDNKGIMVPISLVVKKTKAGLGDT